MPLYVDINVLPKLNTPQFYVIAASDTTISLAFVGNNNASNVIYTIEELVGTTWTLVVNYTATSIVYSANFLHEGRTPNTNYTYRVRAANNNVNPSSDYEEASAKTFLGGLPLVDCAKNKNLIVRMIRGLPLNSIYPKVFCLGKNAITQKVEYTTSYLVANNPSTYEFCFQLLSLLKGCTYIGEDSTYGNIVMKFVNAPTDETVVTPPTLRYRNAIFTYFAPSLYYEFDEVSGNVVDTMNNYTTPNYNQISRGNTNGIPNGGKALQPNGLTPSIKTMTSVIPSTGAFTVVMWVKYNSSTPDGNYPLLNQYNYNNPTDFTSVSSVLSVSGGIGSFGARIFENSTSYSMSPGQGTVANLWHLFAFGRTSAGNLFKYSGNSAFGGVAGFVSSSEIYSGNITANPVSIFEDLTYSSGKNTDNTSGVLIDELTVFNYKLTESDLNYLLYIGLTP